MRNIYFNTHIHTYVHTYVHITYIQERYYIHTVHTIHKVSVSELGPSQEDVLWTDWELPVQGGSCKVGTGVVVMAIGNYCNPL